MKELGFYDVRQGDVFDFGSVVLTEKEIMDFAREYDPMPFHIDMEAALNSPFKGLIASGVHLFHYFYKNHWVPIFKNSVYAGKGITDWMLHRPVYANRASFCNVEVKEWDPKPERGYGVIVWHFRLKDENDVLLQHLDLIVFHKI